MAKISDKLYEKENEKYKNHINDKKNKDMEEAMKTHNKNFSYVGTAYYVAPEVLNKKGYDKEIDWWSVGIIFYEMLVGYAPFCSKETSEVCFKVLNWKKYLKIPSKIKISEEAKDLIFKMINSSNNRLGKNGTEEIKKHPFFHGVDWDNIRNSKPPFIPFLKNEYDTSYFENFEENEPFYPVAKNKFKRKDIEYLGYTFKEEFFNSSDLKKEYEQAIKSIENEFKKEKENNDKKISNENMDLNINDNNNNSNRSWIKKKSVSKDIIKNKDMAHITQIPFRRSSTSKQVKIPVSTNLKLYNNKYKDNRNKDKQSTIPISLNASKHKLNIIHLPLKKNKQNICFSKRKIMHINDLNNNTINSNEDSYSNNYTYRSVKTNKTNNNNNNNSYLINNNIKQYLNNMSLNNSRKNNKLNLGPIYSNKRKLSPQPKGLVFIKKYFKKKKSISLKKS